MGTAKKPGPDIASVASAEPGPALPPEMPATADMGPEHHEGKADEHGDERWRNSSLELEQGLDVIEHPLDSLLGDLLAQFVKR